MEMYTQQNFFLVVFFFFLHFFVIPNMTNKYHKASVFLYFPFKSELMTLALSTSFTNPSLKIRKNIFQNSFGYVPVQSYLKILCISSNYAFLNQINLGYR